MEALEKDFQELVASEDSTVEDEIIQGILEPTVAEEEEVLDDETEEILAEDDDAWEEPDQDDLEAYAELIAELKKENPDIDFDNVDIVIDEDGEIEVYSLDETKKLGRIKKKKTTASERAANRRKDALIPDRLKKKWALKTAQNKKSGKGRSYSLAHHDPSEVSADDAVAIGEEDSDVQEYTVGKQARPTNVMVYRMVDGKITKVRRWTKKGKKGINKGPKSSAHKAAISRAMKVSWRVGARGRADDDAMDAKSESTDYINALASGEETLSETFKDRAKVIFETAVNNEVETVLEPLEEEVLAIFEQEYETAVTEMTEKVDSYMAYVVEQWMEENKVAIESGIRADIAEGFMSGLKQLFTENYITIPEEKVDVVEELATKVKHLEEKLNQEVTTNIEYKKELSEHKKSDIITSLTSELTFNDQEKLKEVAKGVVYEDESDYAEKVQTLKESYFPKEEKSSESVITEEDGESFEQLSGSMDVYTQALARTLK
ncbi:hypothetical protein CL614_07635 [archaeon]|nr:hypothetical protein [archaeon]|tara:strand:+ start:3606 stop:5078 length:1473 start_codon:yes stop_codon:yes gene_type:complete